MPSESVLLIVIASLVFNVDEASREIRTPNDQKSARAESRKSQPSEHRVELKLRTGARIGGTVEEYDEHGLVILDHETPFVFAWKELETGSAYVTRRSVLVRERGGEKHLTAEDQFRLGVFALSLGRGDLASNELRKAASRDKSLVEPSKEAWRRYREAKEANDQRWREAARSDEDARKRAMENDPAGTEDADGSNMESAEEEHSVSDVESPLSDRVGSAFRISTASGVRSASPEEEALMREAYQAFGATVKDAFAGAIKDWETEHFLIWTDWPATQHALLEEWCESMYRSLSREFGVSDQEKVFPAKCPVFCFRSKARFLRFAREFDGYDAGDAAGYTRSIEAGGHVHVVLLLPGRDPIDLELFSSTLVHEGTHAFLHRYHSSRLIPHWVNEGFAELTAERVLGDRCDAGEKATLLTRFLLRSDRSIRVFLRDVGPIAVHQYPIAHSVVAFLERLDQDGFTAWIRTLKEGRSLEGSLVECYHGLTLDLLETKWRAAARSKPLTQDGH